MTRQEILSGFALGSLTLGIWSLLIVLCLALNAGNNGGHFGWIGWSWAIIAAACGAVGGFAAGANQS